MPQVENIDGRWVLIFNCLASEFAPGRLAGDDTGGVFLAHAETALGPYDIAGASAQRGVAGDRL